MQVYGLPFNTTRKFQARAAKPAKAWIRTHIATPLAHALAPLCCALRRVLTACCTCCGARKQRVHSDAVDTLGLPPALPHNSNAAAAASGSEASCSGFKDVPYSRGGAGTMCEGSTHAAVEIDIVGLEGKAARDTGKGQK
jgi:hypothetical protein